MKHRTGFILIFSMTVSFMGCSKKSNLTGTSTPTPWTEVRGLGGFGNIIIDSSDLYASLGSIISRSTDDGMTWAAIDSMRNNGSGPLEILDGVIFYGSGSSGVYLSSDHGTTWVPRDSGLSSQLGDYPQATCFALNGTNVFMGTFGNGVFRSINSGSSWTPMDGGLGAYPYIDCFAVSGDHIFAGTHLGVYLSTDNGANWILADSGFVINAYNPYNPFVVSLAIKGTNVFAGTYDGQVFLSTNNGTSWSNVTGTLPTNREFNVWLAASDSSVFVGCDGGIFASTSNGSSWTNITDNLPSGGVGSIAVVGKYLFVVAGTYEVWRRTL